MTGWFVQVPGLPGITLFPRHTQSEPASPQVFVPTLQLPRQGRRVVVVVVVVGGGVVVVGHSLGTSTLKLKEKSRLMRFRAFLPICSWYSQLTHVAELHYARLVPRHKQKFFLR